MTDEPNEQPLTEGGISEADALQLARILGPLHAGWGVWKEPDGRIFMRKAPELPSERETEAWTPLFTSLETFKKAWENSEGGEAYIFAADDLCDRWEAYKQARFGGTQLPEAPA